jgi:hypothetical protein
MVSYGWDDTVIGHKDFLRGLGSRGAYPGFSKDPLDGFRHLAEDLAGPLASFVKGNRRVFDQAVEVMARQPKPPLP